MTDEYSNEITYWWPKHQIYAATIGEMVELMNFSRGRSRHNHPINPRDWNLELYDMPIDEFVSRLEIGPTMPEPMAVINPYFCHVRPKEPQNGNR